MSHGSARHRAPESAIAQRGTRRVSLVVIHKFFVGVTIGVTSCIETFRIFVSLTTCSTLERGPVVSV